MESIWSNTVSIEHRTPLDGDKRTEAIIIRAGMSVVLTAYRLAKKESAVSYSNLTGLGADRHETRQPRSRHSTDEI